MKKIAIILSIIGLISVLCATDMIIHKTDGNQESFEISEIGSITFSNFVFEDYFNRPNNPIVGNNWIEEEAGGNASIQDNRLYIEDNNTGNDVWVVQELEPDTYDYVKCKIETQQTDLRCHLRFGNIEEIGNQAGECVFELYFENDGNIMINNEIVQSYTESIEYLIEVKNIDYSSYDFDLYIDNDFKGNYPFTYQISSVEHIFFHSRNAETGSIEL